MAQCVASLTQQKIILGTTLLSTYSSRSKETEERAARRALWCFGKKRPILVTAQGLSH